MPKHKRAGPGRRIPAQGENCHEKRTDCQSGESLSDLIKAASLVLRTQFQDYSTIRQRLIMKFEERAAVSPDTRITDLREMIHLHIQASDAVIKIVTALERLAQLSQFVG